MFVKLNNQDELEDFGCGYQDDAAGMYIDEPDNSGFSDTKWSQPVLFSEYDVTTATHNQGGQHCICMDSQFDLLPKNIWCRRDYVLATVPSLTAEIERLSVDLDDANGQLDEALGQRDDFSDMHGEVSEKLLNKEIAHSTDIEELKLVSGQLAVEQAAHAANIAELAQVKKLLADEEAAHDAGITKLRELLASELKAHETEL